MTLAQRQDREAGARYLELVDLLQSQGWHTHDDCLELFRRVVFSILIHNTDDHLRNHGFFIGERGISLSSAYDINPSNDRHELSLAIDEVGIRGVRMRTHTLRPLSGIRPAPALAAPLLFRCAKTVSELHPFPVDAAPSGTMYPRSRLAWAG
jgi:hypothetical protein